MIELIHRYAPEHSEPQPRPANAAEARTRLMEGNHAFLRFWNQPFDPKQVRRDVVPFDPRAWGLSESGTHMPPHEPFAAALSCSDARVPTELVFRQTFHDFFIVRLAGNVISTEGVGSLAFAAQALRKSLRVFFVLGHKNCGAVTAAVDAYLEPTSYPEITPAIGFRSVVDHLLIAVRTAARALDQSLAEGKAHRIGAEEYRERLIHVATAVNSAHSAMTLRQLLANVLPEENCVFFGIYDLTRRVVWAPDAAAKSSDWPEPLLASPPRSFEELETLARLVAERVARDRRDA